MKVGMFADNGVTPLGFGGSGGRITYVVRLFSVL